MIIFSVSVMFCMQVVLLGGPLCLANLRSTYFVKASTARVHVENLSMRSSILLGACELSHI